ncbi:hypothetical protein C4D60_Mb09t25870 [Musa balbisiana]|uniref:Uncharacterized protein n=1 Tax=Musa balbisiana TaxID=52838 RepID=A0A4S8ILK2_MUSBA|nr:hypothetical protein C4D60_Mb09t25870 [Musa balbisiana]
MALAPASRVWKGLLLEECRFFCYLICAEDEGRMVEPFKAIGHQIFKLMLMRLVSELFDRLIHFQKYTGVQKYTTKCLL